MVLLVRVMIVNCCEYFHKQRVKQIIRKSRNYVYGKWQYNVFSLEKLFESQTFGRKNKVKQSYVISIDSMQKATNQELVDSITLAILVWWKMDQYVFGMDKRNYSSDSFLQLHQLFYIGFTREAPHIVAVS